ncbi:MAG: ABC transporter permease [Candidatus Carbobacillus sp.]|nr:ABC transporter permease [Candidatus Carbobacillus sp.]
MASREHVYRNRLNWRETFVNFWRESRVGLFLLFPAFIFLIVFFLVPMLYIFYLSLMISNDMGETLRYGLGNYLRFFSESYYTNALWTTIRVSFYTTLLSLLLAYPLAIFLARSSPKVRGIMTLLIVSPLLVSIVVRNFGLYLMLIPNGFINQILIFLHVIDEPIKLLFTEGGVVIGLSNAYLPFMVLSIATSLYNIDPSLLRASAILGASPWRSFYSVTLPLSLPGIVAGVVLVFSMSMSAYVTPALLGGANVPMLPVVAYDEILNLLRWTYGSALSYILLGTTLILVTIFSRLVESGRFREVFR